jgi:hypothetical protein
MYYITGDMVFKARGKSEYNCKKKEGCSIPYYWLVDLQRKTRHRNSSLGLPKNHRIFVANEKAVREAKNILENKDVSIKNVKNLILEAKIKLDEAIQMLNSLENGQQG